MADLISVSCPGCKAVFELPVELGGETGECTECGSIFKIPKVEEISAGKVEKTETGSIKVGKASPDGATNTVKLSRASIGMVPEIKDAFNFGPVASPAQSQPQPQAPKAPPRGRPPQKSMAEAFKPPAAATARNAASSGTKTRSRPAPRQKPAPVKQKSWLDRLMFWKK